METITMLVIIIGYLFTFEMGRTHEKRKSKLENK